MKLSKRFVDRARPALRRYQKILQSAHGRDCNESDTAVIVADLLAEVLGWDKYSEVTTEFAVRSTFCDLALKVDGKVSFLIEVKCVGTDLKDNHLRQATDYAANSGIEWVLLTNGIRWHAHRMRFEQPVRSDEVFVLDLLDPSCKPADILSKLYLISREGVGPDAIGKFWHQKEATSRYVLAQVLLGDHMLTGLKRQLRRQFPGTQVAEEELAACLRNEIIKREVLEGERATSAEKIVRRVARRRSKGKSEESEAVAKAALAALPLSS